MVTLQELIWCDLRWKEMFKINSYLTYQKESIREHEERNSAYDNIKLWNQSKYIPLELDHMWIWICFMVDCGRGGDQPPCLVFFFFPCFYFPLPFLSLSPTQPPLLLFLFGVLLTIKQLCQDCKSKQSHAKASLQTSRNLNSLLNQLLLIYKSRLHIVVNIW